MSSSLIKSAFIITLGNFLAKIIGAIYRIPLTNILGSSGIGLYQMVFPLYCILLDLSGSGIPSGLSKLISESNNIKSVKILKIAVKLMCFAGLICTVLMAVLSYPIAKMQGNVNAHKGYICLCPALFFVAIISCYRGYFQGKENMYPTAISNVIEQIVKAIFGLIFATLFSYNTFFAVNGSIIAITISELFALIFLVLIYNKNVKNCGTLPKISKNEFWFYTKKIVKTSLPISLASIVLPLSQIIDSIIIINFLTSNGFNGTSLYGIFSGAVLTILNLPVSLCYGISVAIIPLTAKGQDNIKKATLLTAILSILSAVFIYIFANQIIGILFKSFTIEEKKTAVLLLRVTSLVPILLSLTQTLNGYFIGKGKQMLPLISLTFGVIFKIAMELILVPTVKYNIFGAGVSLVSCYLVAVTFNLMYYIKEERTKKKSLRKALDYGS